MVNTSPDSEFISTLRELYNLFSSLGAAPAVYPPDSSTGIHPNGAINTVAATAAGYAPGTVQPMTALPYLTAERYEISLQLLPSTYPITYLGDDSDEEYFLQFRELLNDTQIPPTAI